MKLIKKSIFIGLIFSLLTILGGNTVAAQQLPSEIAAQSSDTTEKINLYFFWGDGCPHCKHEKQFLENLKKKYPNLEIHSYEIWNNSENRKLLKEISKAINAEVKGVPFTIVGDQQITGWLNEKSTGIQIENAIQCVIDKKCTDAKQLIKTETPDLPKKSEEKNKIPETLNLPIFGEIHTKDFSLPVLTIIIAALDGFNPCAMWTLLFLIGLLLSMKNRTRMWILGSTFIVTSAAMYFMFLSAWLNLLLFVGFIAWVRFGIGIVALGGGGYYLREYFVNPDSTCIVSKNKNRKKTFEKLKELTHEKNFFIALIGIALLAIAVNMVELICSAGLPAVYTQMLTLSNLPSWQYYTYLLLYIVIFMLDDLIVFLSAMFTLQVTGLSGKYSRISHLIGGAAMIIIGLLLIFKPEWLMFG